MDDRAGRRARRIQLDSAATGKRTSYVHERELAALRGVVATAPRE